MGAFGYGVWDNDKALDIFDDIEERIFKKYFIKGSWSPKKSLLPEELLTLADLIMTLDEMLNWDGYFGSSYNELYDRMQEVFTYEYFEEWNHPDKMRTTYNQVMKRLKKLL